LDWKFESEKAINEMWASQCSGYVPNPAAFNSAVDGIAVVTQDLLGGNSYSTAWTILKVSDSHLTVYLSTSSGFPCECAL
jgi:hypothetical protein